MSGWIEVLAPVFESKVNELKVMPMNGLSLPKRRRLEVGEVAVDRYVVWLGFAIGV